MQDIDLIETSKENVQPLARGRNIGTLLKGLQIKPTADVGGLFEEACKEWEQKIVQYIGDDPLDLWHTYIRWAQQQVTSDNLAGKIVPLLQRCTREFQTDPRYKDDPRYLQIWIEYVDTVHDPSDIFSFLDANGIGHNLAQFYVSWALVLESKKSMYAEAYTKLDEGLKRRAKPVEKLQTALQQFQHRMNQRTMKAITAGIAEAQSIGGENQGVAMREFGDQISKTRRLVKPAALGASNSTLGATRTAPQPALVRGTANNGGFSIFVDSNSTVSGDGASGGSWKVLAGDTERSKENSRAASQWTKEQAGTIPQKKTRPLPTAPTVARAGIDFQLHHDAELDNSGASRAAGRDDRPVRLQLDSGESYHRSIHAEQRHVNPLHFLTQGDDAAAQGI